MYAHGQQRYRVTPLVKIGFAPNLVADGTIGMNQKGQVVYAYVPEAGASKRPWIWLPENDVSYVSPYGTAGFHELSTSGISLPAIARDLNEAGDVVGQGNGLGETPDSYGTVWQLASSSTPTTIGNFGGSGAWSSAHAISDHSPPKVTGDSRAYRNCACNETLPDVPLTRGFYLDLGSSLVELNPGSATYSWARDIAKVSGQTSFFIAGFGQCSYSDGFACLPKNTPCDKDFEPKFWNNSTAPTDLAKLTSNDAEAWGVNINGGSVGFSINSDPECVRRAVYWASSGSNPVDLGGMMPSGQGSDGSRAVAVNNLANPQVVGWNETTVRALLWEHQSGTTWSVLALNSEAAIGPSYTNFILNQAHDINDDGWIVAWGMCTWPGTDPPDGIYVVLLTPYIEPQTCPEDMNGDGVVNVIDMLVVINAWGSCIGVICSAADINTDSQVNVSDLLALINAWGDCDDPEDGSPQSVEDCESTCAFHYPGGGASYINCVQTCVEALCRSGTLPPEDCP